MNFEGFREFFRLSKMMGTLGGTVLHSDISPESLPHRFSDFFVSKIEQIRSSLDPDWLISTNTVEFSGTLFEEFQLITNACVKAVLQEMPKRVL